MAQVWGRGVAVFRRAAAQMTWITRFLRESAGWYGQLSLPRQVFLGLALVVFPILLALVMLTEALVARLLRSRRR